MSRSYSPFRSPAALARFLVTAAVGLGLDLWSKHVAFATLVDAPAYRFIPGWLEFEVTKNHGAVFGEFQGQQVLFEVAAVGAAIFLVVLFAQSGRKWFYQLVLGLLLAGVLGNFYDRATLGYVRDMIHALPQWPNLFKWIFNLADSYLCVGVGLMIIYSFLQPKATAPDGYPVK